MANLNDQIEKLAADFARGVIATLRGASLTELLDLPARGAGKRRASGTRKWPKCPTCGANAWPWGKGYCFEHAKATGRKAAQAKVAKTKAAKRTDGRAPKAKQ